MNKNYEKINSESECNNLGKTCKKEPGIKEILLSKAVNSNNRLCVTLIFVEDFPFLAKILN